MRKRPFQVLASIIFATLIFSNCSHIDWNQDSGPSEEEIYADALEKLATPKNQGIILLDIECVMEGASGIPVDNEVTWGSVENYRSASGRRGSYRHGGKFVIPRLDPGQYIVREVDITWMHMGEENEMEFHIPRTTAAQLIIDVEAGKVTYGGIVKINKKRGLSDRKTYYEFISDLNIETTEWEHFITD